MPIDRMIISNAFGETRIALMERARLCELVVVDDLQPSRIGEIYLGRVEKVLPQIQAAFVELGLDKAGFLGFAEASGVLREGDKILVQVMRDEFEDKGVKLTSRISLAGRFVVYVCEQSEIKMSRRLVDGAEKERLSAFLEDALGENEGLVVRSAARGVDKEDILDEVSALRKTWSEINARRKETKSSVKRLHCDLSPLLRLLRDEATDIDHIVVNDHRVKQEIESYLPCHVDLYQGPEDLFEAQGIAEQIEVVLEPKVLLASGGSLIINETAGLVVIDVNSGSSSQKPLEINLEAAREAVRQIRLRNLSGLLVVDFLGMKKPAHRDAVLKALCEGVADDPCSPQVVGFTKMGLVEITRKRRHPPLSAILTAPCGTCGGTGRTDSSIVLARKALAGVERKSRQNPETAFHIVADKDVIAALKGPLKSIFRETEARLGRPLELSAEKDAPSAGFDIIRADQK
jgi:ribonuclease G